MANTPSTARVVIIGGGAVGVSSLFHLARAGWSDCVLLEKNELTAGSTWHAAGNVPTFSGSWAIMNIQRYSTELYRGLSEEVGYPMNYHVTGSLRLAHGTNRMMEFERAVGMGKAQGMDLEMCAVSDLKGRYPFLEVHDLAGGLYDPNDGDIDPAQLTQALAKGARDLGAAILRHTPATGVRRENGEWVVQTGKGEIRCEYVVNAAGYYAGRVAEWFKPFGGRTLPIVVMSHQYMLTDEIPDLAKWSQENAAKLPLLRDVDSSYYLRQEKAGLNLGPYERNCRAHWVTPSDPFPEDFSFQLYPDDLDRLEWYIEDAMARVPLLGQVGVNKVINGPIPYAPDGNPLIGPMPGVPNAFEACVFTFGIAQAGGAGKVLAEWITEGGTEWDMWACDPRRYTGYADLAYTQAKGKEVYGHEYAIHYPRHVWPAARDRRLSPNHARVLELGGVMAPYNGWERAEWYARPGDDTSGEATQTWDRDGPWEVRVREECEAVRDHVGVLDLCGFSRFDLSGDGAATWLDGQIAGRLPGVGRIGLAYFPDDRGRALTEMSVARHSEDRFTLITAATAQWHDFEALSRVLPGELSLTDRSDAFSTLIVTGPESRALFSRIAEADLSLPWLSHQRAKVAGRDAALARVSFAGELGWEIHARNEDMPAILAAVLDAGAKPFGMLALNALRIEKGYRAWKQDLSTDYTLPQSDLMRFVKLDKPADFPGKAAILREHQAGPSKRCVTLRLGDCPQDAPYMANILKGDEIVGEITSAAYGYRVGHTVGLGMVRSDLAGIGNDLEVDVFGIRVPALIVAHGAIWDPKNERLRT